MTRHRPVAAAKGRGASARTALAGLACSYPLSVGSAGGTDTVMKEDGGHTPWRQDGPVAPCRSCGGAGCMSSYSAGRAGLLVPPVPEQRARHRQGEGGDGGASSVAARRASTVMQRLQEGGRHQPVQERQCRPARTPPCVGSARGTDRVRKEDGGHPTRRHDGQVPPCTTCEGVGQINPSRATRAGLREPPPHA
jgi:hypothetical protein